MTVHLPRVEPGLNPGGLWVRLCTDDGELLTEHAISDDDALESVADADGDLAGRVASRGVVVRNFFYDGDSGRCIATAIVSP